MDVHFVELFEKFNSKINSRNSLSLILNADIAQVWYFMLFNDAESRWIGALFIPFDSNGNNVKIKMAVSN